MLLKLRAYVYITWKINKTREKLKTFYLIFYNICTKNIVDAIEKIAQNNQ
jgi:hypothetical protein